MTFIFTQLKDPEMILLPNHKTHNRSMSLVNTVPILQTWKIPLEKNELLLKFDRFFRSILCILALLSIEQV